MENCLSPPLKETAVARRAAGAAGSGRLGPGEDFSAHAAPARCTAPPCREQQNKIIAYQLSISPPRKPSGEADAG
jgi:hypothetical protein